MIYKLMNTTGTILEVSKGEIEFAKRINQVRRLGYIVFAEIV